MLDPNADHLAVGDHELASRRRQHRLDPAFQQALEQHGDQRRALGTDIFGLTASELGRKLEGGW